MHTHSVSSWQHDHHFLGARHERNERRTWLVVILTAAMMGVEIIGGTIYGSMALVADGWHMATHAAALAIAALAYRFARIYSGDPRFSFGTGKLGELSGFASAIILAMIALMIAWESLTRLFAPVAIHYEEALVIAVVGLIVNLLSAGLLHDGHGHEPTHAHVTAGHTHGTHAHGDHAHHAAHDHSHHHGHHHGNYHAAHDHNHSAAYFHVLADALTSVLAIVALLLARSFGWTAIDPLMGIFGAAIIIVWAWGLLRSSGAVLLDTISSPQLAELVRQRLEINGDRITDLHMWRVGPGHSALIVALVTDKPQSATAYKALLADVQGLSHVTVEVQACRGGATCG